METFIVLIPLENNGDARKQCELIENTTIDNVPEVYNKESIIKDAIIKLIDDDTYDLNTIEVWNMSNFMDWCNDEQFNPDGYFMSYVKIN